MKKNIWIVIAVVLFFIGLIIAFMLASPDRSDADKAATAAEKSH